MRADEEADIETMKAEIAAEEARIAELQDKIAKTTRSKLDLQVTSIPPLLHRSACWLVVTFGVLTSLIWVWVVCRASC